MPIYVYRCPDCGNQFDKLQSFNADSSYPCPSCKVAARRVLQPAGIVFKGSGWYITDSRKEDATHATESEVKPSITSSEGTSGPASETSPNTPAAESSKPAEKITANPV